MVCSVMRKVINGGLSLYALKDSIGLTLFVVLVLAATFFATGLFAAVFLATDFFLVAIPNSTPLVIIYENSMTYFINKLKHYL